MEYMGHADLQMVTRYVKLLPQPGEDDAADRLNAYLARAAAGPIGRLTGVPLWLQGVLVNAGFVGFVLLAFRSSAPSAS